MTNIAEQLGLPPEAVFTGPNTVDINGVQFQLEIKGEATVTPGPVRQVIIDALTPHVSTIMLDQASIDVITALQERYDIVPKDGS